ncbi:MAG: hypothetical protein K2X87_07685 [Gemmataceae bacterium]|nr:hypothetical protein [Gemmataceae bacterium]
MTGAAVVGDSVTIGSRAEDVTLGDMVPEYANNLIGNAFEFLFNGIFPPVPFGVMVRFGDARVTLTDAAITATAGDVSITSNAVIDASTSALGVRDGWTAPGKRANAIYQKLNLISVGYSQSDAEAVAELLGTTTVTAAGGVTVRSEARSTASVVSRTSTNATAAPVGTPDDPKSSPADPNAVGASIAVTVSDLVSRATVGPDAAVAAGGNVAVTATGETTNTATSGVNIYVDGRAGLGVSVGYDTADVTADVTAEVNGRVTAGGLVTAKNLALADIGRAPGRPSTAPTDAITIPNHGLTTGDEVKYVAEDPAGTANPRPKLNPIGGLLDGETLRVVVLDPDHIQLVRQPGIDLDPAGTDPAATHTVAPRRTLLINPQTAVDTGTGRINLPGHLFANGQEVDYAVGTPDGQEIGGLRPGETYVVAAATANSFRLAEVDTPTVPIALTGRGAGTEHVFGYTAAGKSFTPAAAVNAAADTITVPGHGLSTGDAVVYAVDPSIRSTRTAPRTAFFGLDTPAPVDPTATVGSAWMSSPRPSGCSTRPWFRRSTPRRTRSASSATPSPPATG